MTILIGNYEFDGPYNSVVALKEKPGLYAVLHYEGEEYELVHVAQADNIRERIEFLQPESSHTAGSVLLAACYTPKSGSRERSAMVADIQKEFDEQDDQECDTLQLVNVAS